MTIDEFIKIYCFCFFGTTICSILGGLPSKDKRAELKAAKEEHEQIIKYIKSKMDK